MDALRRARPWVASALLHGLLLGLVGFLARPPDRSSGDPAIEIEVAGPEQPESRAPEKRESPAPEPAASEPAAAGGEPEGARPRRPLAKRPAPPPAQVATGGEPGPPATEGAEAGGGLGLGWGLGALGDGPGAGGRGGGGGIGAGRRPAPIASHIRAARRISRARPPRLVYPRRFRDERGGEVFVAILTIDDGGWVVGARLKQGVNPYADQKAMEAVWRFHYLPALDDSGRPITARVEQRFMVD